MKKLIFNNEGPFSIVVSNIDDFKNINNLYGNSIGNAKNVVELFRVADSALLEQKNLVKIKSAFQQQKVWF